MKHFKYYIYFPFSENGDYIYEDSGEITASYIGLDSKLLQKLVAKLNGDKVNIQSTFSFTGNKILMGGSPILQLRCTTHLICNWKLTNEEALHLQNEIGVFITNQLNK